MIHIYGSVLAKLQQCVLVTLSGSLDFQFKKNKTVIIDFKLSFADVVRNSGLIVSFCKNQCTKKKYKSKGNFM